MLHCLVACEESQVTTIELRKLGHIVYSCDIQECSGGHPEWHIKGDCLPLLNGNCEFILQNGQREIIDKKWDLIIAHPPCTYLSTAATRSHSVKDSYNTLQSIADRTIKRIEAMKFFMNFVYADCKHIAIENPTGVMNTCYRSPDITVHPWYFAKNKNDTENYQHKRTHFWLFGLCPLLWDSELQEPKYEKYDNGRPKNFMNVIKNPKVRSKTFPGIAKAMAEQWTSYIETGKNIKDNHKRLF